MTASWTAFLLLASTSEPTSITGTQDWPKSKAELTQYAQTSSNQEVLDFLRALDRPGVPLRFTTAGQSGSGNRIPLVVAHRNPWISPEQARQQGKLVVYVQANIHAGEVEGKEVMLHMLRDFAQGKHTAWIEHLVLVVVPNYNPDGNDAWGPNKVHRGHQDGPEPVGKRENAGGFDLNRDCMKAATPEFRSVLASVYRVWDPDVVFDLHTTNGTRHGYLHTYSPGLNPNIDPALGKYVQDAMLRTVRRAIEKKYDFKMFDYGNAQKVDGKDAYASFGAEPRYVTNYVSLRNRIGILSEAASFYPFKDRVRSTEAFVSVCLDQLVRDRRKVLGLIANADQRMLNLQGTASRPKLGLTAKLASRGSEAVILEDEPDAAKIDPMKAPTRFKSVMLPIFDRFVHDRVTDLPDAYVVPGNLTKVKELLDLHGISTVRAEAWQAMVYQRAVVREATQARNPFQGVRLQQLQVDWRAAPGPMSGEFFLVKTAQPLGLLAAMLLDPESVDGAYAWGAVRDGIQVGETLEIGRTLMLRTD